MSAGSAFLAALSPTLRARFDDVDVAAVLAAHHAQGQAAYPELAVDAASFGAAVAARLGDRAAPEVVPRLRADHLYLAVAAAAGDARAIARIDGEFLDEVPRAAARLRATPDQAREVRADLGRILFVSEPGRPAAIGAYSGQGDLRSYLRVIATRALVRAIDHGRREVGVDDDFLERLAPASDPELRHLREHYRADVDHALRTAVATLDEQPRALLRYHLIDGWTVDRIGALYGIHRATAARWVAAAREALGQAMRRELATRLAIAPDEVDSIVGLVQGRIDVSLARLLGAP